MEEHCQVVRMCVCGVRVFVVMTMHFDIRGGGDNTF